MATFHLTYSCITHPVLLTKQTKDYMLFTHIIYNAAITYIINIIKQETDDNTNLFEGNAREQLNLLEHLIHATKKNKSQKYFEFDEKFPNFPSYLRRDAIAEALASYKSWHSNYQNWLDNDPETRGKAPKLTIKTNKMPTFYRAGRNDTVKGGSYYRPMLTSYKTIYLKLYNGKTWAYYPIQLRNTDAKYIEKQSQLPDTQVKNPTVIKNGKKYLIRFTVTTKCQLNDEDVMNERICAVDLGVNRDAACCIMEPDGTIIARRIINMARDKAVMYHKYNRIRKCQKNGSRKLKKKWRRINELNDQICIKIVRAIMDFAIEYSCTRIVCEYLDFEHTKTHGSWAYKKTLWRKRAIYHRLYDQAHRWGMRISQVCAWNTSKLAFDGSGKVDRGYAITDENGESLGYSNSVVRFSTGKFYDADFNAAYNIGARYFVRVLKQEFASVLGFLKPVACSSDGSLTGADVPWLVGGSAATLSTLWELFAAVTKGHFRNSMSGVTYYTQLAAA